MPHDRGATTQSKQLKAQAAAMASEVALRIIEDCHWHFKWVSSMDRSIERKDIVGVHELS